MSVKDEARKDEARRMWDIESRTISEIARLFGVSERTVKRAKHVRIRVRFRSLVADSANDCLPVRYRPGSRAERNGEGP